jgi:hypothetical protein
VQISTSTSHSFFSVTVVFLDAFLVYHILRKKTWNLPYLDTSFIEVAKHSRILQNVYCPFYN